MHNFIGSSMDLSGHTCSIQYVLVYIFNQNQIFLTTATNRKKYGLIKSEIRLSMKNQQNTFASTCHMHTSQTAPRRNLFPMRMASHRHIIFCIFHVFIQKSATLQRLESEANIEETLVINTNSKWEKFPVLELKAWSDYIQIDPNRDFRGRIFDAFHNCAFSFFSAFR